MILRLLHSPNLVWWMLFAWMSAEVLGIAPAGWRGWTKLVCWVLVLLELFVLKGAVSWR